MFLKIFKKLENITINRRAIYCKNYLDTLTENEIIYVNDLLSKNNLQLNTTSIKYFTSIKTNSYYEGVDIIYGEDLAIFHKIFDEFVGKNTRECNNLHITKNFITLYNFNGIMEPIKLCVDKNNIIYDYYILKYDRRDYRPWNKDERLNLFIGKKFYRDTFIKELMNDKKFLGKKVFFSIILYDDIIPPINYVKKYIRLGIRINSSGYLTDVFEF